MHTDSGFVYFYEFLTPFFFIHIGMQMDPDALFTSFGTGALLFLAAVLGKFAGVAGPALLSLGRNDAILLGISMIPRAEIAPGYHVPVPAVRRRHCSCTDLFRNGARFAGDIHTLADSTAPHAWRGTLTAIPACFACYLQRMQATPGERIHLDSYIQTEPDR